MAQHYLEGAVLFGAKEAAGGREEQRRSGLRIEI